MTVDEQYLQAVEAENAQLRKANQDLEFRISELKAIVGVTSYVPMCFGLTKREAQMLGVLMQCHDVVTRDRFLTAMYGGIREPDPAVLPVFICKLRRKLRSYGIEISTMWGRGHYLTKEMKTKIREYYEMGATVAA